MAKKVVATLKKQGEGKGYAKVIRSIKSPNGSYTFKEDIVPNELVQELIKKK